MSTQKIPDLVTQTVGRWVVRTEADFQGETLTPVRILEVIASTGGVDLGSDALWMTRSPPEGRPYVAISKVDLVVGDESGNIVEGPADIAGALSIDAPDGLFVSARPEAGVNLFQRNSDVVAKDMIGRWLVRTYKNGGNFFLPGRILETEAYEGGKETTARRGMKYAPGTVYVMKHRAYHLLNIATDAPNKASCVMIAKVRFGDEVIDGPGKVSNRFDVTTDNLDGLVLGGDLSIIGFSAADEDIETITPSKADNAVSRYTFPSGETSEPVDANPGQIRVPARGLSLGKELSIVGAYSRPDMVKTGDTGPETVKYGLK